MNDNENNLFKYKPLKKMKKEDLCLNTNQIEIEKEIINENKKKSKTKCNIGDIKSIINQETGYKIGQYLIKNTIGKGSFGKVKLGIYLPNKEKVAIKILDKKRIIEKDDLIRIKREFELLSKFDHPNIILIAEIFETEERYYSVMEYCEGGELFNYIVKKGHLTEEETSFFFYQLICGLEYIHSLGIVHRDLKPENLLLTKNNLLKIIDFGLSHYHNTNSDLLLETPCGSPCYASPEMVSGLRYDGYKIDIWACGVILFAMLCGYLPFENKDNNILFKKILECKVKFPEYLSKESKDLISKILVKDPNKRLSIKEIKNHPFYIKGKNLFHNNFEIEQKNFNNTYEKENKNNDNNNINEGKDINDKNKKILIIENINPNNDEEFNNKNNNKKNYNAMTYQPILTDYNNQESTFKLSKKMRKLNKDINSVKKSDDKRVKSSNRKNKKIRSSNKTKDNFNIMELLKFNILTHTSKKKNNLHNKKSPKLVLNNFSSGNLMNKKNSNSNNNKNTKFINNTNAKVYEKIVLHTDTNSKSKEISSSYINNKINSNQKNKKILYSKIKHKKMNNIVNLNKKGINYLNILNKNKNINNLNKANKMINNLFDRYIQRIIDKKSANNSKNKSNIKSKEKVTKLIKKGDDEEINKNKLFNTDIDKINRGQIDSEMSSCVVNTEPNHYFKKLPNSNNNSKILLNEIIKNININIGIKKLNDYKLKNNLQIIKQKSIPTLSNLSEHILKNNNLKKNFTTKNRKNIINNHLINKQKLNLYNKKTKKIHNSLTKKNYFFTIRNTMINLNIHTPSVIISAYNKKGINNKPIKKYNSNFKFSDVINIDDNSISKYEEKNKKKLVFAKTGLKTNKNKMEYEQLYRHCNTYKNDELNNKINNTKIRNFRDKLILQKKCNLNINNDKNNNKKTNNKIVINKKL